MLTAAYLTTAFVVLAVGARYLVAGRHEADGRTMVRMAIGMIAVLAPLQLFIGDQHGLNTLKHQPIKIAAMEAHWDGSKPGDFHIFAWPDEKNEVNRFAISIPRGSSLVLTHDPNGLFPGLKSVPPSERPPVVPVFFAFRIMVGIGLLMIATGLFGAFLWWRGKLVTTRWYLRIVQYGWPARLHRGAVRLDHHRGRAPAVDRLRHPAHRRCDLAGLGRERADDADPVRHRLRHRVQRWASTTSTA